MNVTSALIHIFISIFLISFGSACSNGCTRVEFNYTINPLREKGHNYSTNAIWGNFTVHTSHMAHVHLITKEEYDKMRDMEQFTSIWSRYNVTHAQMTTSDINVTIPFDKRIFVAIFNPSEERPVHAHWIMYQSLPNNDNTWTIWFFGSIGVGLVLALICWCCVDGCILPALAKRYDRADRPYETTNLSKQGEKTDQFHLIDLKPKNDQASKVDARPNQSIRPADAELSEKMSNHSD